MAEIGSFRTGIGGFNKADVLNYIDELNANSSHSFNTKYFGFTATILEIN